VRRSGPEIGRAAVLLTALTTVSALFGLGRDVVIAAVFGATAELDAYLVAQGLMNVVLGLAASAVATAVVPVVAREAVSDEGIRRASHSVAVAMSVMLVVLGIASLILWLAAGPVVMALAPGFDGAQADLAIESTRILLVAVVLVAGTNLLAAAAQARRRFFWAGVQGVPFNLVMIVAAVGFGPRYGVAALAVGFVVGSATRLACQFVPLRDIGLRLRLSFDLTDPGFRAIARLAPALLVGSGIGNVNTLVDRAVGSLVGEGTISALSYGWRLVTLPETLLIASLVTALYPAFGSTAGDRVELRRLVGRGLSTVMVVVVPICAGLLAAAGPLVTLVYEHGNFDRDAVAETATALRWYVPALLALSWREVVVRASYAVGDSRTPMLVAVLAMVVNVVGDLTLGRWLGIAGLAASTSAAICVAAVVNTWLLAHRHQGVCGGPLLGLVARTGAAGLVATLVAFLVAAGVGERLDGGAPATMAEIAVVAATVSLFFWCALRAVKAPETSVLRDGYALLTKRRGRSG
jgi:putative peptidoglycan lipid II flippase